MSFMKIFVTLAVLALSAQLAMSQTTCAPAPTCRCRPPAVSVSFTNDLGCPDCACQAPATDSTTTSTTTQTTTTQTTTTTRTTTRVSTTVTSPACTRCTPVTSAQIDYLSFDFQDALDSGDAATVTALYTDDAVMFASGSDATFSGLSAIRSYYDSFLQRRPVGVITRSYTWVGCNVATRAGKWTVTTTDPSTGSRTSRDAYFTVVYRFEDSEWKISSFHSGLPLPM